MRRSTLGEIPPLSLRPLPSSLPYTSPPGPLHVQLLSWNVGRTGLSPGPDGSPGGAPLGEKLLYLAEVRRAQLQPSRWPRLPLRVRRDRGDVGSGPERETSAFSRE